LSILLALFPQNEAVSLAAGNLYGWSVPVASRRVGWLSENPEHLKYGHIASIHF